MTLAKSDPRHGTINGYSNLNCRCQRCRAAWADYIYTRRRQRMALAAAGLLPDSVKHGLATTYSNWRCKCRPCLDAHNATSHGARTRRKSQSA